MLYGIVILKGICDMLSNRARILNFDDSLIRQEMFLKKLDPEIVDFKRFGVESRIWLDQQTADEIYSALDPGSRNCPTFVGSGDYHHLSSLLVRQFEEPLTLIVFDHHPDWDILPPRLACASWITHVLRRPNIKKVVLIGVSSEDISTRIINTGNLQAFARDRLEIYPYRHRDTNVFFRQVPANSSITVKGRPPCSVIQWRELFKENIPEAFAGIISRVDTRHVYISIDKDCLKAGHAMTNWEEGFLELKDMLRMLLMVKERFDIIGVDIVGDYSKPVFNDVVKKMYMFFDRHRDYTARDQPMERITAVNERTNLEIIKALTA